MEGDQLSWVALNGGASWKVGFLVLRLGKSQTNWDTLVTLVRCKHRFLSSKEKGVETFQAGVGYFGTQRRGLLTEEISCYRTGTLT